eukprot:gnl/MRDRNA2_/MRDRNA2_64080_c0_seq2.p1 gnl/MRDRNA2_/MRDRNA2_64080_c0~~gnl/MRDRNA2_/MRDRNA2_64080_c0_seq2.p1  ORF type:complete len:177 (+),score=28.25 gnl/MRDRNA2_/MRDRNA2_64080_c0_seq2:131-661(+)
MEYFIPRCLHFMVCYEVMCFRVGVCLHDEIQDTMSCRADESDGNIPEALKELNVTVPQADWEKHIAQFTDKNYKIPGFFHRMKNDALNRRFVQWNASNLARGKMSASRIPGISVPRIFGISKSVPQHLYFGGQGSIGQLQYKQVPMMKMSWDLQLYSMLLSDLRPKTLRSQCGVVC